MPAFPQAPPPGRARHCPRGQGRRACRARAASLPGRHRRSSCGHSRNCRSVCSMPRAHSVPGSTGMRTLGMPHSTATSAACSGPAPPKAASAKSRDGIAALDRNGADRPAHIGVGDLDDAVRGRLHREAERLCDCFGDHAPGGVQVDMHAAAEQGVRIEPAQAEIGVGDRRLASRQGRRPRDRATRRPSGVRP